MAYDRLVAICFPLRYPSINTNVNMLIIIGSCWLGLIIPLLYMVLLATKLSYCASLEIPSYFCGYGHVHRLASNLDSTESRKKSISTCVTHLILVLIFYVPLMVNYMLVQLSVTYSGDIRNISVVLSSTLPPMLNPIIYSLKTEEVRAFIFRAS
nr:PREDICTED: olfactory receptor 6Y1-like [Latimeria chalumnae]|eukprot:XP_014348191.1 PREDICTED: olfactory receptor 6Y1-like [Latimeria chalumnae]